MTRPSEAQSSDEYFKRAAQRMDKPVAEYRLTAVTRSTTYRVINGVAWAASVDDIEPLSIFENNALHH